MKNYLAIMLLVPSLLVTACGKDDADTGADDTESASDEGADSDDDASGADHTINTSRLGLRQQHSRREIGRQR